MKKNLFLLWMICGFVQKIIAADPSADSVVQNNRFLIVVENTAAMSRSAKAAQQTVRELIKSGGQGEMRAGDTFGIWTFDDQLNTTFPVQTWMPSTSELQALSVEDFLKQHRYKNKGQLSVALPKVYSLIKASKSITVILITTGTEPIRGTPFDKEMNMIYPQYSKELRDAKIPFVTVLIGFAGRPVAFSINSSLGPIHIPQPPLKPKTTPVETNFVAVSTNTAPVQKTNEIAPIKIEAEQEAVPNPPEIAKVESKETYEVVAAVSENTSAENAPAFPTEATKSAEPPKVPSERSIKTTVVTPAVRAKKTEPTPVVAEPVPSIAPNLATTEPSNLDKSEPTHPQTNEKSLPPASSIPVVATQSLSTPKLLLLAGAVLLLVAGVLIYLLLHHSGKSQPSLISHSIDRKK